MKNKKHTPLLAALATLDVLLAGVVLIWLAKVRPDVGKGRSEIVTDFLRAELLQDGQTATQVFTYDKDILTIGLEFYLPGDQPCGALDVVLYAPTPARSCPAPSARWTTSCPTSTRPWGWTPP